MVPAWNRKQPGSYDCTVQPLSGRYRISATPKSTQTATPRPTLFTEHGKNYYDTVISRSTNATHFES